MEIYKEPEIKEALVNRLIDLLTNKEYEIGDKLPPEREMAKILGTNRNTLREALKILQTREVLDIRHGSGVFLKNKEFLLKDDMLVWVALRRSELYDFVAVREALESKAIDTIPIGEFGIISDKLERLNEGFDYVTCSEDEFLNYDNDFHSLIRKASGNHLLYTLCSEIMKTIVYEHKVISSSVTRREASLREHDAIIAAFRTRNVEFIKSVIIAHFESIKNHISVL